MSIRRTRTKSASLLLLALGGILAATLTACSSGGDSAAGAVKVALPGGPNVSLTPYLAADGSGAFAKQGVDVETQEFATGVDALAALSGGSVDIAAVGGLDMIRAGAQNADLVSIFVPLPSSGSAVIAAKGLEAEHGTDIASFADSRWGYAREGTSSTFYLQTVAEKSGVNWNQTERAALGSQAAILAALQADRIDLVTMDATTAAKAVDSGVGYVVLNMSDPAVTKDYWGPQLGSSFATTQKFIDEHPDRVQGFVTGMIQALKDIQASGSDAQTVYDMFTPDVQKLFGDSWSGQWAIANAPFKNADGLLTDELLNNTVDWAKSVGALPADLTLPPSERFINNSFVENASS
ncbi:ABC transporter substrate-binding protein [Rhodococcus sp. NPDC057529]|uniref:ABC transporter substrate-binding protein n=1 Tax=Rhodococcus sp. NPDC057529 TaxID=3346158 RepID=UPI00366EC50D